MFIKQLYTGCLSEAAYYIESEGEAAVIDPLRDIDAYLTLANERKSKIKYIFETHFHADFVSGHLDLSKAVNAPIVYGPGTKTNYPVHVSKDNETFKVGKITLKVLHTPGHTLESACYLLTDESGKDYCVFTGDTLFVGDVGRPDLVQKGEELTMHDLAGIMFNSIHSKLFPLADDVIVYPAHGPGSACGKNLGPHTQSTIGEEKRTNYALRAENKEDFIKIVTDGITAPPHYFSISAKINKDGYESLNTVLEKSLTPLKIGEFKKAISNPDSTLLDTRNATVFSYGFIPGSVFIGLEGRFAEWAGSLLSFKTPIYLVTETGKEKESIVRLTRVGFSNIKGYLDGGFEAWKNAGEKMDLIIDIEPDELMMDIPHDDKLVIVDVRQPSEYADGHLKDALNIPLNDMTDPGVIAGLEEDQNLYIHCAGGYRSMIASSLLKKQGYHNLRNVVGGWNKIKEQEKVEIIKETSVLN